MLVWANSRYAVDRNMLFISISARNLLMRVSRSSIFDSCFAGRVAQLEMSFLTT